MNLGCVYEEMKEHDTSKTYHEQGLSIATLVNDRVAKIKALGNLGKIIDINCNLQKGWFYVLSLGMYINLSVIVLSLRFLDQIFKLKFFES